MEGTRALLIAVVLLTVPLAGCAAPPQEGGVGGGADDVSDNRAPIAVALAPEDEELALVAGASQRFAIDCHDSDQGDDMAGHWRLVRDGGIDEQEWGPLDEALRGPHVTSSRAFEFNATGEYVLSAWCTDEAGAESNAVVWTVVVGGLPGSDDDGAVNEDMGEDADEEARHTPSPTTRDNSTTKPPSGNLTIHFVDVGQGDAIVLHFPDTTVVVDTANRFSSSYQPLLDHLAADGPGVIDRLVVTHPDADHAGGCDEVLGDHVVAHVFHPGLPKDTQTWTDCHDAIQAEGARIFTDDHLDPGDWLNWSMYATVQLLHVDASRASEPNDGGIVARVSYGEVDVLLTGDISCDVEDEILARTSSIASEILKVAHHGSRFSTCNNWLGATTPRMGIVSVGDNSYGHPTQEVLDRLASHGVEVYRTDQHGDVTITTDGTTWDIVTEQTPAPETDGSDGTDDGTDGGDGSGVDVRVSDIHEDAGGPYVDDRDDLNDEYVEIVNDGTDAVDLSGWTLVDAADHTYTFPSGFTLDAGATVTVHTGDGTDTDTDLYWGSGNPVWNNGGDTAFLYDSTGSLVDQYDY